MTQYVHIWVFEYDWMLKDTLLPGTHVHLVYFTAGINFACFLQLTKADSQDRSEWGSQEWWTDCVLAWLDDGRSERNVHAQHTAIIYDVSVQ